MLARLLIGSCSCSTLDGMFVIDADPLCPEAKLYLVPFEVPVPLKALELCVPKLSLPSADAHDPSRKADDPSKSASLLWPGGRRGGLATDESDMSRGWGAFGSSGSGNVVLGVDAGSGV